MLLHMCSDTKECELCGKTFTVTDRRKLFCSRTCSARYNGSQGKLSNIFCKWCGKEFKPRHSVQVFCSLACVALSNSGENSPVRNDKLKTINCPVCKTEFRQKRMNQECCCFTCKQILHSEKMLGKNNPAYKNGSGFGNYCEKFNREFKKRVKLFWNNTCVICGSPKSTVVHHVYENKDACCNTDTQTNKFVVLCRSCHNTYHQNKRFNNDDIWNELHNKILKAIETQSGKTYYSKEEYRLLLKQQRS